MADPKAYACPCILIQSIFCSSTLSCVLQSFSFLLFKHLRIFVISSKECLCLFRKARPERRLCHTKLYSNSTDLISQFEWRLDFSISAVSVSPYHNVGCQLSGCHSTMSGAPSTGCNTSQENQCHHSTMSDIRPRRRQNRTKQSVNNVPLRPLA